MTARRIPLLLLALPLAACASGTASASPESGTTRGDGPRTVQPGAPGQDTRELTGAEIQDIQGASYTDADVAFMQGMIHHHAQALRMTALVPERATSEGFRRMALRMRISQTDEIGIMESWLRDRALAVPDIDMMSGMLMHMPGMLSAEQMETLRASEGEDFERYFLQFMIQHHGGALVMVQDLFATPGAGQESTVNFFANEVDADQTIEILRMQQMLQEMG